MKSMSRRHTLASAAAVAAALTFSVSTAVAADGSYTWPKLLVVGTTGTVGSTFAPTNGWAAILQKEIGTTVRIVPVDNELQRMLRLTDRKDIAISGVTVPELRFQVEGLGGYAAAKPAAQRIVWHLNDSPWGFVTSGKSDLQSIADVKKGGVRVAEGVFAPTMSAAVRKALPAFLDIPLDQADKVLKYVPASSYAENCRAVVEDKADVAWCSAVSAVTAEMEGAPGGIRWLSLPSDDQAAWERYLEQRPTHIPTTIDFGVKSAHGTGGISSVFVYSATPDADADLVYNLAKWFHGSYDAYKGTHAFTPRMSLELFRKFLDHSPMPVHEGTIRYLREIGAWTDADDAWNKAAIEKMDRWVAARQAAMDEARGAGVKIDFQNEEFLAILRKHTDGLESFRTRL